MKYLPIQINKEWCLREVNPYEKYANLQQINLVWQDFEKQAIATARLIINHDGREWYDKSEVEAVWEYYDFQEQIWKTTDTKNITVFENTFEQYSEFYRKTRQAWKYIGEKPVEKETAILSRGDYEKGIKAERTRIIGIIEPCLKNCAYKNEYLYEDLLTKINNE